MNIVMIMSGGVGRRFGSLIPKQYNLIAGRPVIDFVIDAVRGSRHMDHAVVVMDAQWMGYSESLREADFDIAPNGETRFESMQSGLELIKAKYPCEKLVIVDAVAPFITAQLIDEYFDLLDEYDAVITAQKITGGFTDKNNTPLNRDDYIITQSPEAFRFPLLYENFDVSYPYQETACMLPKDAKRLYYYDFRNNLKLTYDFELEYAEFALRHENRADSEKSHAYFDKNIFHTEGLKSYLLRLENEKTEKWLDDIYAGFPSLIDRWKITSFLPSQVSRYGLVLSAKSQKYGDVVIKYIPWFVDRYERELEAMRLLPKSYMCTLYDWDESQRVMLMSKVQGSAKYASFEDNRKLTSFFHDVLHDAVEWNESIHLEYIPDYFEELCGKLEHIDDAPFMKEEVEKELILAIEDYKKVFSDAKLYVVHGDLHELNILDDGERWWGIDPNGMLAPLEIECVRFIRNDVRTHAQFGYKERFELLVYNFARMLDVRKLVYMFIIDMAFCTYNSTFENETTDETILDLELIRIAREYLRENGYE